MICYFLCCTLFYLFRFNIQDDDTLQGNGKKSHDDAKALCKNIGGRLYEPRINDLTNPSYLALVDQWIHIQGKNTKGWLGIESKGFDWVYSESGDEPTLMSNRWNDEGIHQRTFDGSCVYLSGNKKIWTLDSCGVVHGFICEFKGIMFDNVLSYQSNILDKRVI